MVEGCGMITINLLDLIKILVAIGVAQLVIMMIVFISWSFALNRITQAIDAWKRTWGGRL